MKGSMQDINDRLTKAGPLSHRIIGVYACEERPAGAATVRSAIRRDHPCLAKALFKMSTQRDVPAVYVSRESAAEACSGLMMWFGFTEFPPHIERMFASDSPADDSMCIKRTAELSAVTLRDMGRFTPAGEYIVLQALDGSGGGPGVLKSLLCFGRAEQILNLGALIHFGEAKALRRSWPLGLGLRDLCRVSRGNGQRLPKEYRDESFAVRKPEATYPKVKGEIGVLA